MLLEHGASWSAVILVTLSAGKNYAGRSGGPASGHGTKIRPVMAPAVAPF